MNNWRVIVFYPLFWQDEFYDEDEDDENDDEDDESDDDDDDDDDGKVIKSKQYFDILTHMD